MEGQKTNKRHFVGLLLDHLLRRGLKRNLAGGDVFPHHPVAHEAVERELERRRAILLEEEVTDPSQTVTDRQTGEQTRRLARNNRRDSEEKADAAADKV